MSRAQRHVQKLGSRIKYDFMCFVIHAFTASGTPLTETECFCPKRIGTLP